MVESERGSLSVKAVPPDCDSLCGLRSLGVQHIAP